MPWLSMYLTAPDVQQLCQMLDHDPDIALIRSAGPGKWKAQREIPTLPDGDHALYHIPSGPIVLEPTQPKGPRKIIKNPFRPWTEIVKPFAAGEPWFGPAPLGIIRLSIRTKAGPANQIYRPTTLARPWSAPASQVIGRSDFHWIGRYYSIIGDVPAKSTEQWWNALRRRIAKTAKPISSSGPLTQKEPGRIWAFPHALQQIRKGAKRADNPA
jgi:hypothetical protein